ncbi:hypothetical protein CsatB_029341 [Cannabis sativa]
MSENEKDTPSTYGQMEGDSSTPLDNLDSETQTNIDDENTQELIRQFATTSQKKLGGSSRNGMRHLHDHFKICPLRKNRDIKQSILNPSRKKDGSTSLAAHNFDQEFSREKLAKMIVLHEYPLNMVEDDGFRSFVKSLQPLFRHVSQTTIRRDILKIYEKEKTKTMNSMNDNRSRVAITTDLWTSNNQKRGYMVVTAHYTDDSWILRNRIIRFIYVPAPHTAKLLAKVLMECLIEWSIERKLSTLTSDNCTVNIAMMDQMKEKLRNASY